MGIPFLIAAGVRNLEQARLFASLYVDAVAIYLHPTDLEAVPLDDAVTWSKWLAGPEIMADCYEREADEAQVMAEQIGAAGILTATEMVNPGPLPMLRRNGGGPNEALVRTPEQYMAKPGACWLSLETPSPEALTWLDQGNIQGIVIETQPDFATSDQYFQEWEAFLHQVHNRA